MTRPVIHSCLLGLLALVGVGYVISLRWPWGAPGALGVFSIFALIIGALGLAWCGWAGAIRRRGGHVPPWSLLLAPAFCVVLAGLAEGRGMPVVMREYEELLTSWSFHGRWFWLADELLPVRIDVIVGLLVAGLGFAGAAVTLTRAAPGEGGERGRRWVVVLGGAAAIVAGGVLLARQARLGYWLREGGPGEAWDHGATRLGSLAGLDGLALWWPLLLPVAALALFGLLRARRGAAIVATLGAGLCLSLAAWLHAAFLALHNISYVLGLETAADKQAALGGPSMFVSGLYHAEQLAGPLSVGLFTALALAAIVSRRPSPRSLALPLALVLGTLLLAAGFALPARRALDDVLGPYCEERCSEIDRIHAAMTFRPWHTNQQIDYDPCFCDVYVPQDETLQLPRIEAVECVDVAVHLQIRTDRILVDGARIVDLADGHFVGDAGDGVPQAAVRATLDQKKADQDAIAARVPGYPFLGRFMISADADTPMGTVDAVRAAATGAGFEDHRFVVEVPGHEEPRWLRKVRVDSQHPGDPRFRLEGEDWTLQLDLGGARLQPPGDEPALEAGTPSQLAGLASPVVARRRAHTAVVHVHHHPEVTLGEELRYRAALEENQLFNAVYTGTPPTIP